MIPSALQRPAAVSHVDQQSRHKPFNVFAGLRRGTNRSVNVNIAEKPLLSATFSSNSSGWKKNSREMLSKVAQLTRATQMGPANEQGWPICERARRRMEIEEKLCVELTVNYCVYVNGCTLTGEERLYFAV